jgi:hypothetical protein
MQTAQARRACRLPRRASVSASVSCLPASSLPVHFIYPAIFIESLERFYAACCLGCLPHGKSLHRVAAVFHTLSACAVPVRADAVHA